MTLFRPVGIEELALIFDSAMNAFPPRLPDQPIFYPVTNFGYADQIARDWNTKSGSHAGYVTTFEIDNNYVSRFERKVVGGREHEELWVPAEELPEFNRHINGSIEVDAAHFGEMFSGLLPSGFELRGKNAIEQFICLHGMADYNLIDFYAEIFDQRRTVFCHFAYWRQKDSTDLGITTVQRDELIAQIERHWEMSGIPFGLPRLKPAAAEASQP